MPERDIENAIREVLSGDMQQNALAFTACLRAHGMQFERGGGYWADKLYWLVQYQGEYVCFILLNGPDSDETCNTWTVWSDDSGSNWYEDSPLDEHLKEIGWEHVDICENCGGCGQPGGSDKCLWGKMFHNVCITTMRFINPDAGTLAFLKKMVEIRKNDILKKHSSP